EDVVTRLQRFVLALTPGTAKRGVEDLAAKPAFRRGRDDHFATFWARPALHLRTARLGEWGCVSAPCGRLRRPGGRQRDLFHPFFRSWHLDDGQAVRTLRLPPGQFVGRLRRPPARRTLKRDCHSLPPGPARAFYGPRWSPVS